MNLKQPRAKLALEPSPSEVPSLQQARKEMRRKVEELKVQVIELAETQMDITVRVIRSWLSDLKK